MMEGGYAEGGMKMRTRSETEGVRAGGVDSQISMRKYYRPKSEADRKRRDHERILKNRQLANISNARKKKRIEEIQEANRSLKEESRLLDEANQRLEEQIKLAYQKLDQAKARRTGRIATQGFTVDPFKTAHRIQ
ncbi:hypothetical protein NDN08_001656 [Rhodosorus marinus]|uniref:BZIP domain-containing protein n=1 Tax=Rhodosorus marinus TaxID=101924 RepID=A0AAV8UUG4_9RHOD|nr:hypothetical protein NDN08_001656 [Rhodosorus marinus]